MITQAYIVLVLACIIAIVGIILIIRSQKQEEHARNISHMVVRHQTADIVTCREVIRIYQRDIGGWPDATKKAKIESSIREAAYRMMKSAILDGELITIEQHDRPDPNNPSIAAEIILTLRVVKPLK
jgi:hypothetical protein